MYLGRKANPCANRHLRDLEIRETQASHKARIRNMKPSIDNAAPTTWSAGNTKRLVVMEERYAKIEHENRLLLNRMSEILIKPGGDNSYGQGLRHSYSSRGEAPPPSMLRSRRSRSLNNTGKRRELLRITRDNLALLGRLQAVKPVLSSKKWAEAAEANARLVESISEYKQQRGGGRGGTGSGTYGEGYEQEEQQQQQQQQQEDGYPVQGSRASSLDRGMQQLHAIQASVGLMAGLPHGLPGFGAALLAGSSGGCGATGVMGGYTGATGASAGSSGSTMPFNYTLGSQFPSYAATGGSAMLSSSTGTPSGERVTPTFSFGSASMSAASGGTPTPASGMLPGLTTSFASMSIHPSPLPNTGFASLAASTAKGAASGGSGVFTPGIPPASAFNAVMGGGIVKPQAVA